MTAAQYTLPSLVGCSVISVTHNRLGPSTLNWRLTKSELGFASGCWPPLRMPTWRGFGAVERADGASGAGLV